MTGQPLKRGFVLHRRDYRNSSLLLELFVADHGRLACIAKGAKAAPRGRSALATLLQPFQPLWLSWVGRGEVKTLTRAEPDPSVGIVLSAERLYCGFYLNELLLRLIGREDPQEALFVFYQQALADLATEPLDAVLRRFELRLLEELGYALDLTCDRHGKPVDPARQYRFVDGAGLEPVDAARWARMAQSPEAPGAEGPQTEAGAARGSASAAGTERPLAGAGAAHGEAPGCGPSEAREVLISGVTLARLASGAALQRSDAVPARALMRAALAPHLGPKPLRSRELFRRRST